MKISYSAPAKVILSGEHAVVYGKPALVSAVDLRLKFSVVSRHRRDHANFLDPRFHGDDIMFISKEIKKYLTKNKISYKNKHFRFKIESEIPVGRGLGSSAALSVATVSSFLEFYTGKKFEKKIVNNLAFQIEKHFHQNPSGVDNSAACFGGLILYQKKIQLTNLNYKIPKNIEKKLFLIDSGKPEETTGEMVKLVESVKSVESVESVKNIFNKIETETKKISIAIKDENTELFKESITSNEKLLEDLGVVSKKAKKLLVDLSAYGVGKITGAGGRKTGSGFILFFAENKKGLIDFLKDNRINYYQFIPDYQGLKKI